MRYGYFDDQAREYVIDRVDVPFSMTNYLGTQRMGAVISHNAGGYCWLDSPQYHRITRFRPNGVPMDFPGHYVYLRDDATGKYWSVSWQPTGLPLEEAKYVCRHGLSYSTYECEYEGIQAKQTLFIPREKDDRDPVEIFDVRIRNTTDRVRQLSAYGYVEFSFHHIDMDNQNFQMSLYACGSHEENGAVLFEAHYEENSWQFFAGNFEPDGFDGMTYAETFYQPMIEVVEYLQANGFKCYIVSGSDRFICRTYVEGVLDIPYENIIGMDVQLEATNQGEEVAFGQKLEAIRAWKGEKH